MSVFFTKLANEGLGEHPKKKAKNLPNRHILQISIYLLIWQIIWQISVVKNAPVGRKKHRYNDSRLEYIRHD